jgi:hypothetical protein
VVLDGRLQEHAVFVLAPEGSLEVRPDTAQTAAGSWRCTSPRTLVLAFFQPKPGPAGVGATGVHIELECTLSTDEATFAGTGHGSVRNLSGTEVRRRSVEVAARWAGPAASSRGS